MLLSSEISYVLIYLHKAKLVIKNIVLFLTRRSLFA